MIAIRLTRRSVDITVFGLSLLSIRDERPIRVPVAIASSHTVTREATPLERASVSIARAGDVLRAVGVLAR